MNQEIIEKLESRIAKLEQQIENILVFCDDTHLHVANLTEMVMQDQEAGEGE